MTPREEFEEYSRQRLYPRITNASWLVLSARRRIFTKWLAETPTELSVLDVGGALQPYRSLLPQAGLKYTAIDLNASPLVDKIASADALPFPGGSFDMVICTQVLEYVADPAAVFVEIRRVLKLGGRLIASAPSIQARDADNDNWRFSRQMLSELTSDFARSEIVAEIGTVATVLRTINVWVAMHLPFKRLWRYTLFPALNAVGACFGTPSNPVLCANFALQAWK